MRGGGWMVGCVAGGFLLAVLSGCVPLEKHRRVDWARRNTVAEKEALEQELFDARNVNDSLRTRVSSLERELDTKNELIANLRKENELLDEMRKTAQSALEGMADRQVLPDIGITGPRLPERLDSALKRFADEHPTAVVYDPGRGTVKWKADLLFALGSDVVKESSKESLRSFTEVIKSPAAADFEVIVVGHTDNTPIVRPTTKTRHPTNWHLSGHRAISVAFALQDYGYAPEQIGVMGYGEYRPIADNATEAGKSQNRRVEIYLVPKGTLSQASTDTDWQLDGEALAFVPLSP